MSVRLGGGTDRLTRTLGAPLTIGTGAFSLGIWLKRMADLNDFGQVCCLADAYSPSVRLGLEFDEDGTSLTARNASGYGGMSAYATPADAWLWADVTRSGTTLRLRMHNASGTKVHDETITHATSYTTLDTILIGQTGSGISAFDGELQLFVVQTGIAWSDGDSWAQAQKFALQAGGDTEGLSYGLETTTANQYGLNEYGGNNNPLSNTGVVDGASRPGALESAGGTPTLLPPAIVSGAVLTPPAVAYTATAPTIASGTTLAAPSLAPVVAPPAIGAGSTLFAPTVAASDTLGMPHLASGATLSAPTVTPGPVTLALPIIAAGSSLAAPALAAAVTGATIGPSATLTPPTLAAVVALPTIAAGSTLTPPTVSGAQGVAPPVIGSTATLYPPSVAGEGVVIPPTIGPGAALYAPTVVPGAVTLGMPTIASGSAVFAPAAAYAVGLPHRASTAAVFAPAVVVVVAPPAIGPGATLFAPSVQADQTLALATIPSTAVLWPPVVYDYLAYGVRLTQLQQRVPALTGVLATAPDLTDLTTA